MEVEFGPVVEMVRGKAINLSITGTIIMDVFLLSSVVQLLRDQSKRTSFCELI